MVATVEVLTRAICLEQGLDVNVNPQSRAAVASGDHICVSRPAYGPCRRFSTQSDYGDKGILGRYQGCRKMSDAIYECQLVGQELRTFEDRYGPRIRHYAIIDGKDQWNHRGSDLVERFTYFVGLLDELLVGKRF